MKILPRLAKICLTVLTLLLISGCGKVLPDFPPWSPYIAIFSDGVKLNCTLDADKMIFNCDGKNPIVLDKSSDGDFCTPKEQIAAITTWVRDAKKKFEKECNNSLSHGR